MEPDHSGAPARSHDEGADAIARNLSSVGIQLKAHVKSGILLMYSGRTEATSPDERLIAVRALVREHQPRCMVIDPLSALVLMGTLRWEKEAEEKTRQNQRRADVEQNKRELQFAEADARARITAPEVDLQRKRTELASYSK